MKHFGNNIDQLVLQNPQILKAMEQLKLPNAERYYEQIKHKGTDTIDGINVKMILKDGNFKTKAQEINENFFECAEKDWENIGVRWLKNKSYLSQEVFENEVAKLKEEYYKIDPGETVTSESLGFSVRKRRVKDVQIDEENLKGISPLIAKIVVSFLHYVLSFDELRSLDKVEDLINHARHSAELRPYTINWCPLTKEIKYNKFHRVWLSILGNSIFVDVTFFGFPNWRIILNSKGPIIKSDLDGKLIKNIIFILDFEDIENRQKYIRFDDKETDTPAYYEFNF